VGKSDKTKARERKSGRDRSPGRTITEMTQGGGPKKGGGKKKVELKERTGGREIITVHRRDEKMGTGSVRKK